MSNKKEILVIIPARSGSKGLPGKNIKNFHGAPLIAWSIAAGLEIGDVADVIVSTDSQEYAELSIRYGALVPILRPDRLATDTATTFDTVIHMIEHMERVERRNYKLIILLEPTSPLRPVGLLREIVRQFQKFPTLNSVITVGDFWQEPSIQINPQSNDPYEYFQTGRRQDLPDVKFPYGLAYTVKKDALVREKGFYIPKSHFINIDKEFCAEIDDHIDWKIAWTLAEKVIDEGTCCRPRLNGEKKSQMS